jgi:hypothetical protein
MRRKLLLLFVATIIILVSGSFQIILPETPAQTGADPNEPTWKNLADNIDPLPVQAIFDSPTNFVISFDGTYSYADNSVETVYGGPGNAGGVDGTNQAAVIQAAINHDSDPAHILIKDVMTNLTSGLIINKNMELQCSAPGKCGSPNLIFDTSDSLITVAGGTSVVLSNLAINGQGRGGHGIDLSGCYFSQLDDITVMSVGRRGINNENTYGSANIVGSKVVIMGAREEGFYINGKMPISLDFQMLFCAGNGNGNANTRFSNVYLRNIFYSHIGTLVAAGADDCYGGQSDVGLYLDDGIWTLDIGTLYVEDLYKQGLIVGSWIDSPVNVNELHIGNFGAYNVAIMGDAANGITPILIRSCTNGFIDNIYESSTGYSEYPYTIDVYNINQFVIGNTNIQKGIRDYYGNHLTLLSKLYHATGHEIGTGAPQAIAHGCNFTPTYDQVILTERTTGGATPFQTKPPTEKYIFVQAPAGKDFTWRVDYS